MVIQLLVPLLLLVVVLLAGAVDDVLRFLLTAWLLHMLRLQLLLFSNIQIFTHQ